jgi:hypothetical protein
MVVDCAPGGTPAALFDTSRGQWRDTGPRRVARSRDLPLFEPPEISLVGQRSEEGWDVALYGGPADMTVRWSSEEGSVAGAGRRVLWCPASPDDQLAVAVRTEGGVAVATFRSPAEREGS